MKRVIVLLLSVLTAVSIALAPLSSGSVKARHPSQRHIHLASSRVSPRLHVTALANAHVAGLVVKTFGKSAVYAYNRQHRLVSLRQFKPSRGATLYATSKAIHKVRARAHLDAVITAAAKHLHLTKLKNRAEVALVKRKFGVHALLRYNSATRSFVAVKSLKRLANVTLYSAAAHLLHSSAVQSPASVAAANNTTNSAPATTTTIAPTTTTTSAAPSPSASRATTSGSPLTGSQTSNGLSTTTTEPASQSSGAGLSTVNPPSGYSNAQLEFVDGGSGSTIGSKWNTYITSRAASGNPWDSNGSGGSNGGNPSDNLEEEYYLPSQVSDNNGIIDLHCVEQSTNGMLGSSAHVYPYTSGVVSSYGKFQFTGGYLQVEAKMPAGDGMWPALWMLPGPGASNGDNYEIDLFEGGASDGGSGSNPSSMFSWHLHYPGGVFGRDTNTGVNLTSAFHTYGLQWLPGQSITWYLDGQQIGQVTSAQAPIPNEPMELIMNLAIADSGVSNWHTAADASTPSTADMLIGGVQVYS